jgi:hypothetical protein
MREHPMYETVYVDLTREEAETVRVLEGLARKHFPVHYYVLDIVAPDWCWASFVVL